MIGIYKITNKVNGRVYVGQSICIERRWKDHIYELNEGRHRNSHLQKAWNKYGKENFVFEVLEECLESELDDKETYWWEQYQPNVYNLAGTGTAHNFSKETREKMRKAQLGKKMSAEAKKKIAEASRAMWKEKGEEFREFIREVSSKTHKGLKHNKQTIELLSKISTIQWNNKTPKEKQEQLNRLSSVQKIAKANSMKKTCKKIVQLDLCGNFIREWASISEASRQLKICRVSINSCCKGKHKFSGNYKWLYATEYYGKQE